MDVARMLLYFFGGILVLGGLVLLFYETGLSAWVPAGIAIAGLVILAGLLLMGLSDRGKHDDTHIEERHYHDH